MIGINSINTSNNSFNFTIQTNSGDKISMSMYDNQELDYESKKDNNSMQESMSLRHEFGYNFSYTGNGIDKNDKSEIEKAMKIIRPIFHNFLKNIEKNGLLPHKKDITNLATKLKNHLPDLKTKPAKLMLKDKTLSEMDSLLSIFKRNKNMIDGAKKLFDKLFSKINKFEIYA